VVTNKKINKFLA